MKNKPKLLTIILTMLFSFAVTSEVWAECTVTISPSNAIILPGDSLTFTATTEGEGCNEPNYTWEISEMGCTGSSIDPDTGTYTAGADDNPCEDIIMVTDTANDGITAIAVVDVAYCLPSVSISGPATLGPPCPVSATYTAETVVCDIVSGKYTWELDGVSSGTANTTKSFDVTCTEADTKTLMVTDTANGNMTDSIMIQCDCPPPEQPIQATFNGCGRTLFYSFGVVTIQGTSTVFGLLTTVRYDSPLIVKTPRLVNRTLQRITQFVILLPSILFPEWDYPAAVEVTVDGVTDNFEIPACR